MSRFDRADEATVSADRGKGSADDRGESWGPPEPVLLNPYLPVGFDVPAAGVHEPPGFEVSAAEAHESQDEVTSTSDTDMIDARVHNV